LHQKYFPFLSRSLSRENNAQKKCDVKIILSAKGIPANCTFVTTLCLFCTGKAGQTKNQNL